MQKPSKPDQQPEHIFLLCSIIFGLISLFVTPPFQSPDEYSHFFRAFYTSEGGIIGDQASLPASVVELASAFPINHLPHNSSMKQDKTITIGEFSKSFQPQPRVPANINSTIFYSFIPYFPQSIGIWIGTHLSVAPISIHYFGRLFNLLFWIFLVLLAIRITPIHKWVLVVLASMPMTLFQAASNSTDPMINGLCFLFIAFFLSLLCDSEEVVSWRKLAILFTLGILIVLSKHIYGFIVLLVFLIPISKMGGWKRYLAINFVAITFIALITLAWYSYVSPKFIPNNPGSSPTAQIEFIKNQPLAFGTILVRNIFINAEYWGLTFVGIVGWLDTMLPIFAYYLCAALLIFCALFDSNHKIQWHPIQRIGLLSIFFFFTFLIITSMFIQWEIPGSPLITGVQGRYFIPFAWLILLVLYNNKFARFQSKIFPIVFISLIIILDALVYTLVVRYYI